MIRKPTKKEIEKYGFLLYLDKSALEVVREKIDSLLKLKTDLLMKELNK